jgi:hypothetical protein
VVPACSGIFDVTTKRVPIDRPRRHEITARAVELFVAMEKIECVCSARDWAGEYWKHEFCQGCERWWRMHSQLHRELRLKPWHWPAYTHPEAVCPYPEGTPAAQKWKPDTRGHAVFRALEAAAREARRQARPRQPTPAAEPR